MIQSIHGMFFHLLHKLPHICIFIILTSRIHQIINILRKTFLRLSWAYDIVIELHQSQFVFMIYAQNAITYFGPKSLKRIIKDEKNKDINSVLWNNRNSQLGSRRKTNFHTIA